MHEKILVRIFIIHTPTSSVSKQMDLNSKGGCTHNVTKQSSSFLRFFFYRDLSVCMCLLEVSLQRKLGRDTLTSVNICKCNRHTEKVTYWYLFAAQKRKYFCNEAWIFINQRYRTKTKEKCIGEM